MSKVAQERTREERLNDLSKIMKLVELGDDLSKINPSLLIQSCEDALYFNRIEAVKMILGSHKGKPANIKPLLPNALSNLHLDNGTDILFALATHNKELVTKFLIEETTKKDKSQNLDLAFQIVAPLWKTYKETLCKNNTETPLEYPSKNAPSPCTIGEILKNHMLYMNPSSITVGGVNSAIDILLQKHRSDSLIQSVLTGLALNQLAGCPIYITNSHVVFPFYASTDVGITEYKGKIADIYLAGEVEVGTLVEGLIHEALHALLFIIFMYNGLPYSKALPDDCYQKTLDILLRKITVPDRSEKAVYTYESNLKGKGHATQIKEMLTCGIEAWLYSKTHPNTPETNKINYEFAEVFELLKKLEKSIRAHIKEHPHRGEIILPSILEEKKLPIQPSKSLNALPTIPKPVQLPVSKSTSSLHAHSPSQTKPINIPQNGGLSNNHTTSFVQSISPPQHSKLQPQSPAWSTGSSPTKSVREMAASFEATSPQSKMSSKAPNNQNRPNFVGNLVNKSSQQTSWGPFQ